MKPSDRQTHWNTVYQTKDPVGVSWHQPDPAFSLALLGECGLAPSDGIIDIGGGASVLVDCLIERGHQDVTVLDIAEAGLAVSKNRLKAQGSAVHWVAADITQWKPARTYQLWHDRAVFHFLTDPADRLAYVDALRAGLAPGGHVLLSTFAPDGPEKCSGLVVARHSAQDLAAALGADFTLLRDMRETHRTPGGSEQRFQWALFRRS